MHITPIPPPSPLRAVLPQNDSAQIDDAQPVSSLQKDVIGLLRNHSFGRSLKTYREITSTNTVAMQWADSGAPEGSVVQAEYQRKGRGRHGKSWHAQAGLNLLFSVILRPRLSADRFGLLAIAAGLAICEALDPVLQPTRPMVKWPNDILVQGRKCCGMLFDTAIGSETVAILGLGVNVNQAQFPRELQEIATSLLLETGRHISRPELFVTMLDSLERHYDRVHRDPSTTIRDYEARLDGLGEKRGVHTAGGGCKGFRDRTRN